MLTQKRCELLFSFVIFFFSSCITNCLVDFSSLPTSSDSRHALLQEEIQFNAFWCVQFFDVVGPADTHLTETLQWAKEACIRKGKEHWACFQRLTSLTRAKVHYWKTHLSISQMRHSSLRINMTTLFSFYKISIKVVCWLTLQLYFSTQTYDTKCLDLLL